VLQSNIVASLAIFTMLVVCALGIGFLVRFFIALASEENQIRVVHPIRYRGIHYATDGTGEPPRYRWSAVDSGAHIALGVLRITTALPSNPSRASRRSAPERSNIVMFAGPGPESDSATEPRYRSS